MRYSDFSGKRAFKHAELSHELRDEKPFDLAKDRAQVAQKQAQAQSKEIKMVAMHYLTSDHDKAKVYMDSGIKLKQDRRGSWYLPRYNTSGRVYQEHLARLKADNVVSGTHYFDRSFAGK